VISLSRALPIVLLIGCSSEDDEEYREAGKTQLGYHVVYHVVYHDAGLLATGTSYEAILGAFDLAMLKAAYHLETTYGLPASTVLATPHQERIRFVLVDRFRFAVGDQYATGHEDGQKIGVAMHRKGSVSAGTAVPFEALPWTVFTGEETGTIYYGTLDLDDSFPALAHELGHLFFGADFEH
jgi:hypothetical protein